MAFDRQKFKQLLHYVIWKAGHRDWFGATKLYKVLWFADARAYTLTGKSITGATYLREKYGPVPKAAMPVREELEREGAIRARQEGNMCRFTALVPPDMSGFSKAELQAVDYWIEHIDKDHTAGSISDRSHDYAWDIAQMGEELPFYACFSERIRDPDDKETAWAKEVAERLRLP